MLNIFKGLLKVVGRKCDKYMYLIVKKCLNIKRSTVNLVEGEANIAD